MSHQIICGQLIGISGIGTNIISTMDIHTAASTLGYNYNYKAAMSFDGLFVPFSTDPDDEYLLHFEIGSGTRPRATDLDGINISNIQILSPTSGLPSNLYQAQPEDNYYKGIALRAPLVLAGFGYNADRVSSHDPELYTRKCGPVDLAWDDVRKVWCSPLSTGTSTVNLARMTIDYDIPSDSDGEATLYNTTDKVQIINFLSQPMVSGAKAIGWNISDSGYIVIQHQFYSNSVTTNVVCNSGTLAVTTGTIYTQT